MITDIDSIVTVKVVNKHSTCPNCGSNDVFMNDSIGSDCGSRIYLPMYCDSCNKRYQSQYVFKFAEGYEE